MKKEIAVGYEDFQRIREENCYYVDKTTLIQKLVSKKFEAVLITRPRRFGKTLTMSMLENFFDCTKDSKEIFKGLEISKHQDICDAYMNQYPTIFISLKGIEGLCFESAFNRLCILVAGWISDHMFLFDSVKITDEEKRTLKQLSAKTANYEDTVSCLKFLAKIMYKYYEKPVILLIDEYDVPLAKASENGYYKQMVDLTRAFLGEALKTNPYLKFAVITGCLRIAKESIFTGANNFVNDDLGTGLLTPYIGFTETEVNEIVNELELPQESMQEIKEWYDGYLFGDTEMYCPWSVLNHLSKLQEKPNVKPQAYWAHTSHNGIIYHFIERKSINIQDDFETLMSDGAIRTDIEDNLTYDYLRSSEKNFWTLLYLTGYLTKVKENDDGSLTLRIPNKEVKDIFKKSIIDWYETYIVTIDRNDIYDAMWDKDIETAQRMISKLLINTISYHDYHENYFHSFIAGIFSGDKYDVKSNDEEGEGRPDIVVKDRMNQRILILEIKYAKEEKDIPSKMKEAIRQIGEKRYVDSIDYDIFLTQVIYGVVFYRKRCYIQEFKV